MFCRNCGKEIDEKAVICPHCGVQQSEISSKNNVLNTINPNDNGGFGWGLLGCCVPLVGLILFLVWKDTKPKTSKAAGVGALVGVGAIIALYAFIFFMAFIGAMSAPHYYY